MNPEAVSYEEASVNEAPLSVGLIHEGCWETRSGQKAEVFFSDDFGYVGRVDGVAMGWYPCGECSEGISEYDIVGKWKERTEDYVPYAPSHRDELRGKWFRFRADTGAEMMVNDLQVVGDKLYINGWSAVDFLENCCWLTGELCGRLKLHNEPSQDQFVPASDSQDIG